VHGGARPGALVGEEALLVVWGGAADGDAVGWDSEGGGTGACFRHPE
jgi:hypothetical protein